MPVRMPKRGVILRETEEQTKKPEGQFKVRCIHTGCKGSYFQSSSRYATLCAECGDKGHIGSPRNCRECSNESATGVIIYLMR